MAQALYSSRSRALSVLLVEDQAADARITQKMLEQDAPTESPLHITRAARLLEALEILEEKPVDVVVLDLSLPDGKGPDSILKINQLAPNLPIVVLSGMVDEVNMLRSLEYGAQEFLIKGECSGVMIRQAMYNAIFRKSLLKNRGNA